MPFLGFHLLRTRRDLNLLRAELRQRGLIAPPPDQAAAQVGAGPGERLIDDHPTAQQIAPAELRAGTVSRAAVPPHDEAVAAIEKRRD